MRRVARILLNAATSLSLVLFITSAILWARSYTASDALTRESINCRLLIFTRAGALITSSITLADARGEPKLTYHRLGPATADLAEQSELYSLRIVRAMPSSSATDWQCGHLRYAAVDLPTSRHRLTHVPLWLVALAFAIVPTLHFGAHSSAASATAVTARHRLDVPPAATTSARRPSAARSAVQSPPRETPPPHHP